ncbi:MAG: hypothetical protein MJH10_12995 [Epibacterium sp.]|nr:hypothetical protein [Epibacterium sp.]NQX74461.1 hypothetical protein [Epibacterium sp.]
MSLVLKFKAAACATWLACLPLHAQASDLPPDLPDLPTDTAVLALGDFDLPPAESGLSGLSEPRFSVGEDATLELETRLFSNHLREGNSRGSLRQQAHYFGTRSLGNAVSLTFNLRARADWTEGQNFELDEDFNFDVQELALSFALGTHGNLQLGRINLRNGVATGFNPTDWFRDNSLVVTGSAAAADRRNERLGVVAVTGTTTLGRSLLQLGYRPEISAGSNSFWTGMDSVGLGLDRTNATEAGFVKFTPDLGTNLSVTANALVLDGQPGVGLELSGTIGDNLVLYAEVMGQRRRSLAAEALTDGVGSATLRADLGANEAIGWHGQSALGLNWALPQKWVGVRDISLTFEHHFNGAGLSSAQIATLSSASDADAAAAGALYGLANRRQDPLARQQLFARLAWNDVWNDADLSMLAFYVPADGSGLGQVALDVPITQAATLTLRAVHSFGGSTSVYGANPNKSSLQAAVIWRF